MNLSEPTGTPQTSAQRNMTARNVQESFRSSQNTWECLTWPKHTPKFHRTSQTSMYLSEPWECIRIHQKIRLHQKTSKSFENPLELLRTHENASEHFRMSKNVSKAKRAIKNRSESMRTPQNELEQLRKPNDIIKHLRTLRILSEPLRTHENASNCYQTTSQYASEASGTFQNSWKSMSTPQITSVNPVER